MPLRIAAAGGRVPLENEDGDHSEESNDAEDKDEDSTRETPKKKKAKKEQRYSDFVYKSKFNALLEELKRARDDDRNGKSPHRIETICLTITHLFFALNGVSHAINVQPRALSFRSLSRPWTGFSRSCPSMGSSSGHYLVTCPWQSEPRLFMIFSTILLRQCFCSA
jgi:hypothetical protein